MSILFFIIEIVLTVAVIIVLTYGAEYLIARSRGEKTGVITTKKIAMIGVFSAISALLMCIEIPLPFAPPFYKLDFSEIPVIILTFAYGPIAGVITELLKVLIKLLVKGTTTMFVGDLANFIVGCSFILAAGITYIFKKTKKGAVLACILGTVSLTLAGTLFNAVYLLPKFAEIYGIPLDAIISMGTEVNARIVDVRTFAFLAVAPFNLLKGTADSVITMLLYKKISPVLKKENQSNVT